MTHPKIAFLGTPEVAVPVLKALAGRQPVAAVFANPDRPAGRGRVLTPPPIKSAAEALGLPVFQPLSWKAPESRSQWQALGIELAIVVAYGHILPAWMIDSCALGVWNLHFSLLPRWRGAAPVNHAIWAGDEETGVSLMRITPGLDAGPVLAQSRRPIRSSDNAEELLGNLSADAAALLAEHLEQLLEGSAVPAVQDPSGVTLAPKLSKEMAHLNPALSGEALHRQIRALQPWPGAELQLGEELVKVLEIGALKATIHRPQTLTWNKSGAWLCAVDGQALELIKLQRPGKPGQPALQALQPWGTQGEMALS